MKNIIMMDNLKAEGASITICGCDEIISDALDWKEWGEVYISHPDGKREICTEYCRTMGEALQARGFDYRIESRYHKWQKNNTFGVRNIYVSPKNYTFIAPDFDDDDSGEWEETDDYSISSEAQHRLQDILADCEDTATRAAQKMLDEDVAAAKAAAIAESEED